MSDHGSNIIPWAYALLGLGMGVYVVSFVIGPLNAEGTQRSPTWARIFNSATLVLAALILWLGKARGTTVQGYAGLILLGMAVSFLGDLLMARVIPAPMHPIPGMAVFALAQVSYLIGYLMAARTLGLGDRLVWTGMMAIWAVIAVVVWWTVIRAPEGSAAIRYGSLVYALLLASMAASAIALAVQEPRFVVSALGALLFVASDIILGNRLFRGNEWRLVGDVVWSLYISGQALIVFALNTIVGV